MIASYSSKCNFHFSSAFDLVVLFTILQEVILTLQTVREFKQEVLFLKKGKFLLHFTPLWV